MASSTSAEHTSAGRETRGELILPPSLAAGQTLSAIIVELCRPIACFPKNSCRVGQQWPRPRNSVIAGAAGVRGRYDGRAGAFLLRYTDTMIAASVFAGSTEPLNVAPSSSASRGEATSPLTAALCWTRTKSRAMSRPVDRPRTVMLRAVTAPSTLAPASTVTSYSDTSTSPLTVPAIVTGSPAWMLPVIVMPLPMVVFIFVYMLSGVGFIVAHAGWRERRKNTPLRL